ncbi:uncharacterized protein F4807DRAFT_280489 [Annulohypoxylon truncatum]|uniref:uncharacterized protein n=1 Tax=Annulohypoxylon truncatum TaxID=327061 RepID=UPI0020082C28|nr:uncharacterized protein F4807DRAFT_280489 [Annulohypoxylon truncatum]KAI1205501.1 hypothetical protein F4807DRAFT_280489 [Annulohypoxylon truncatum]
MPSNLPAVNSPFSNIKQEQSQSAPTGPNPFTQSLQQPASQPGPSPAQPFSQSTTSSQIPTKATSLPMPTAGTRKPGGPNQTRGGARGGGNANRGGRGGAQGRASLNPSADNFQPGNKRPRGDSEISNNAKRVRGGGPH